MEKNTKSKRFSLGKIIIALLLCLFCSVSFVLLSFILRIPPVRFYNWEDYSTKRREKSKDFYK